MIVDAPAASVARPVRPAPCRYRSSGPPSVVDSRRARGRGGHERRVGTADGVRTEPAGRGRRCVAQEAGDAVEEVAAREEPAEHLVVQRVHPLAADLERVRAADDRHVVLDLRAPDQLVDVGLQEERIAEPERRAEPHAGVGVEPGTGRRARPGLARIREVRLVDHPCRQRREPVDVHDVDARRIAFDAVGRGPVGRDVERLVLLARVIEVPGTRDVVVRVDGHVDLAEQRRRPLRMLDRRAFVETHARLEEAEQRRPLAVRDRVDERLVRCTVGFCTGQGTSPSWRLRFGRWKLPLIPSRARKKNALSFLIGPPIVPPYCSRWKSFELGPVREVAGESLEPLEVEGAAPERVRARLGDDVDDAAGRAAVFGRRAAGDDLELLDGIERDVDRRALSAGLLAEEPVVVVAAVEADVVEDAALAGKRDLVAVGALDDADAGRERQQILELATENRNRLDRRLVDRRRRRGARRYR